MRLVDDPKAVRPEQIIIQVKGGKTGVKDVCAICAACSTANAPPLAF